MPYAIGVLDSGKRARDKQASRERDNARLSSGEVSQNELRQENGFFSSLPLHRFRIAAIGGRPLGHNAR
jgi:hypothetical protein